MLFRGLQELHDEPTGAPTPDEVADVHRECDPVGLSSFASGESGIDTAR